MRIALISFVVLSFAVADPSAAQRPSQETLDRCTRLGVAAAWARIGLDRGWDLDRSMQEMAEEEGWQVSEAQKIMARHVRDTPHSSMTARAWESAVTEECILNELRD